MSLIVGGVDYSAEAVHIALVGGSVSPIAVTKRSAPALDKAIQLERLGGRTEAAMHEALLLAGINMSDVSVVMVEQPGAAKFVPKHLFMAQGVIMAALSGMGFAVVTYPPPSWKKAALGKGDATKEEIMEAAVTCGYGGDLQDEADAVMIAEACRLTAS